jgi:uncharacterized membrane protein YcjF (UPF0283 family)
VSKRVSVKMIKPNGDVGRLQATNGQFKFMHAWHVEWKRRMWNRGYWQGFGLSSVLYLIIAIGMRILGI